VAHDFQADIDAVQQIGVVPTILDVVCRVTGARFAAVARVTEERWIACSVRDDIPFGMQSGGELPIETTFCNEIRQSGQPIIIDHVAEDETYCGHPIPAKYGIQSYISVPIFRPDGRFFGTLCALDIKPIRFKTPQVVLMFELFAELIGFHLDALDRLASSHTALLKEREEAGLRERFIAVLAHELRNPLEAINANTLFLLRAIADERVTAVASDINVSVRRMSTTTNDLLNFARGHFGGGLVSSRDARAPLRPLLEHVIAESRLMFPDRMIEADFRWDEPVHCDRAQLTQLFSNLVNNALTYGAKGSPVRVCGFTTGTSFELSVSNSGDPIPAASIPGLFRPFTRGAVGPDQHGLGLGLYIASEIARAHNGTLTASSSLEETRFTFRMPLAQHNLPT
jgi:signal transduction histidine kinase